MSKGVWVAALVAILLIFTGCTVVPKLTDAANNFPATSSIPISEIVERVKCELSDALDQKTQQPNFRWMANWTAKAETINSSFGIRLEDFRHRIHKKDQKDKNCTANKNHPYHGNAGNQAYSLRNK